MNAGFCTKGEKTILSVFKGYSAWQDVIVLREHSLKLSSLFISDNEVAQKQLN